MTEMRVLAGLTLSGSTLTETDRTGALGHPAWDPARLLADLELRLGLAPDPVAPLLRVQSFAARMAAARGDRFYTRSYRRDPVGTAEVLLDWRDQLVLAGWSGQSVAGGGDRLAALAELEADSVRDLAPGVADRARAVERGLEGSHARLYDVLALAEDPAMWPLRWRRIFDQLARTGTRIEQHRRPEPCGPAGSDLARLQSALAAIERGDHERAHLSGDGSLLVLRAATTIEAAHTAAAILARWGTDETVLIRGGAPAVLDAALTAHGLAPVGGREVVASQPALQLLPLAVELIFAPKDPYRLLDLLTLPVGPFHGITRYKLASAVVESPGLGGRAWQSAKQALRERLLATATGEDGDAARRAEGQIKLVETWLEGHAHDQVEGAPRDALAAVGRRVADWARGSLAGSSRDPLLHLIQRQAQDFIAALHADPRVRLSLVATRLLLAGVSRPAAVVSSAGAGRVDTVDRPGSLLCRRDTVLWWHFAGPAARPPDVPWRMAELDALAAAGIATEDPAAQLRARATAWRAPVLLAARRLVLVAADFAAGDPLDPHPLWSEIQAVTDEADVARVTIRARDLLDGRALCEPAPLVEALPPLHLPASRLSWHLPVGLVPVRGIHSAQSIQTLVGCPLRFVFEYGARLRSGRLVAIPAFVVLYGRLGHRLMEELHRQRAFDGDPDVLGRRAAELFDALLPAEASPLLLAGHSFELHQLRHQMVDAILALGQALADRELTVSAVEVTSEVPWQGRTLSSRIDVLAADTGGGEAVIDLKWGRSRARQLLEEGRAVQLALYVHLRRVARGGGHVVAGYFSLSRAELLAPADLALPGQLAIGATTVAQTWPRVERTVIAVERALAAGRIPATGVAGAPPLAQGIGADDIADEILAAPHGAACEYCEHDPLCGRRWEGLA